MQHESWFEEWNTRWVRLDNGTVIVPPGPLPYFWNKKNGDVSERTKMSVEQCNEDGWFHVKQENLRDYDPEIEGHDGVKFAIIDGVPTETHVYSFAPGARNAMLRRIDHLCEQATHNPLQVDHTLALQEATSTIYSSSSELSKKDYPMLAADIGNEPGVDTIEQAAANVLKKHKEYTNWVAAIRLWRKTAKAVISAAKTDKSAYSQFQKALAKFPPK